MGILNFIKNIKTNTKNKAVFCGLDSAGKSTIISFLREGRFVSHTPTMGKKKAEFEVDGTRMALFDMGGQSAFREMWLGELQKAKLLVYVIDKSNTDRYGESREEFMKILPLIKNSSANVLILANKHDLVPQKDLSEIISTFNLFDLENFEIISVSAKTGYNMAHAFTKFYSLLTDKQIKRSQLAEAISIYGCGGDLILTKSDEEREVNQKVLEGGFFSAITAFYNQKFNSSQKIIKFENEDHGTFLVARSEHYIASVLWTKDLGVELEESESALKDLLEHLENCVQDPEDKDSVAFHCEHYITNLI